jgi:hypothetical protein
LKIHLNIILPSTSVSPQWSRSLRLRKHSAYLLKTYQLVLHNEETPVFMRFPQSTLMHSMGRMLGVCMWNIVVNETTAELCRINKADKKTVRYISIRFLFLHNLIEISHVFSE